MFKKTRYAALIFMLLVCNTVRAGYEDGAKAAKNGDFVTALREFMPLAEQGDSLAQFRVGGLYLNGAGVEKNKDIAFKWFLKSANNGNASAQLILASDYHNQKKYNLAAEWYAKLVEKGSPEAMFYLAEIYRAGAAGVPKDLEKSASLMKSSAEKGYDNAKYSIGMYYYQGIGIEKDVNQATYWFKKSADSGNADGKVMLDHVIKDNSSSSASNLTLICAYTFISSGKIGESKYFINFTNSTVNSESAVISENTIEWTAPTKPDAFKVKIRRNSGGFEVWVGEEKPFITGHCEKERPNKF